MLPLPALLLCAFFLALWVAGGASRADVAGQAIVRAAAWLALVAALLLAAPPRIGRAWPVGLMLGLMLGLALVQLVPLPPVIWQALPGRAPFAEAAAMLGEGQPWRPLAIMPAGAINAAGALIVPIVTFYLMMAVGRAGREWQPAALLILVAASALVGLIQFTGASLDNPFVNDTAGDVRGTFANRNHFATLLAIGCLVAPVWAFRDGRRPGWRAGAALGLVVLFELVILGTGSRSGLLTGGAAILVGVAIVRRNLMREWAHAPKWALPAVVGGVAAIVAIVVLVSVMAGRAAAIDRAFAVEVGADMRVRALPTIVSMLGTYFPVGSGLGGFDAMFRVHEPYALLKPTFFNHAHNDYLEVVLDAGLPGALLIAGCLAWWAWKSVRAWRGPDGSGRAMARTGSAILLLLVVASAFDYPVRTPLMMAVAVIAAVWLAEGPARTGSSPLPAADEHL
ncbi:O-antigen ligase family protein [Sphingomonas yantingensis]|uniref:O-antigen ligase n=1 Tax=Sphingomonas yantingensis TaxID=1241761 RepID=A0A7W9EJE8_9SPHN|nr:O-antigen ligase family protein [Sphingomonas yantingensis]MBB5700139.1 O-antigen ligase [Sphingomonas yantingensis]